MDPQATRRTTHTHFHECATDRVDRATWRTIIRVYPYDGGDAVIEHAIDSSDPVQLMNDVDHYLADVMKAYERPE